ncbi:MAG: ABC transporter permease [Flavobacteriia bacterium]|nr:ABC transporter permease [Flavobacteriia bacterium]
MVYRFFNGIGDYALLMWRVFRKPESWRESWKAFWREVDLLGIDSLWIVSIISLFMGAVVTIQTALNLDDPFIPDYYIAIAVRESIILEFSPTMVSLILAGKVGSNIASTIGTMRTSEQIDALEVMGINAANYLILPKIAASVFFNPMLLTLSLVLGLAGGYLAGEWTGMVVSSDFILGLQMGWDPFYISYAIIKMIVFAFLIASISAYFGFTVKGGAVEVGRSSTTAVVNSSLAIIVFNYILTDVLLN